MTELIVTFVLDLVKDFGYLGIFIMMTIESSFIPFPSEIAMIPAGYHASSGNMSFILAFLAGTFGALFGASINYFLGLKLGGPIIKKLIDKFGKYIFVSKEHYSQAEIFFKSHGGVTTFNARFIPAVRQLISLPAGVFKYSYIKFLALTGAGAGLWNLILMTIGYVASENQDLIKEYSHYALLFVLLIVVLISVAYYFINKFTLSKKS